MALIIIIVILNYLNLARIDRKISFSFVITEFFDTALEMRRFEKNYFLYGDREDYLDNINYTNKALEIIRRNKESIKKLSIETNVNALEAVISEYKELMQQYHEKRRNELNSADHILEGSIRQRGKKIVEETEAISVLERNYIQTLVHNSKGVLLASIIVLSVVGWLIGQYLSHLVVEPLKKLESSMDRIVEGKFDWLNIESSDREIISLSNACSRMIKELEVRQKRFVAQSEKLALLGTMVSGVAHELNNPLSNIYTSSQILQEEIDSDDKEYKNELLQQIAGEVERAKNMVHSLLEFSRQKEFKKKTCSLREVIDDTLRLIQGDIPSRVDVQIDISGDMYINMDRQRIQQALLNIIKNGIDAIPDEGEICISSRLISRDEWIEIRIHDSGTGIEPEDLAKIFDSFFTTKDEGKGSGLGLFVAREIIDEHQGTIEVESTLGEGTVFSIKLPVKEA